MRSELSAIHTRTASIAAAKRNGNTGELSDIDPDEQASQLRSAVEKFLPHGRFQRMTQEAKGVFIPYPLLGIILTLAVIMISGIIALEVQVSSLNTTILLRDADSRAEITAIKEKSAQLEVYIHNDREKLVHIETVIDQPSRRRQ